MTAQDSSARAAQPPSEELPALMATITSWLRLEAPIDEKRSQADRLRDAPAEVKDAFRKAMRILSGLKEGDVDPWLSVRIKTIVRKSTRCIVFLDDALECSGGG